MISIENFDLSKKNQLKLTKTSSGCCMDTPPHLNNKTNSKMGLLKIGSAGEFTVSNDNGSRNHTRQQQQQQPANAAAKSNNQYKPVILMKAKVPESATAVGAGPSRNSSSEEKQQLYGGSSRPSVVLAAKPQSPNDAVKTPGAAGMVMSRSFIAQSAAAAVAQTPALSPKSMSKLQTQKETPKTPAPQPQLASIPLTPEVVSGRLTTTPVMASPVKLLDENLAWHDGLQEFLLDQPDFLVIGVIGKERTGKSTLMSYLAGSSSELVFTRLSTASPYQATGGIQAYISNERTILLDVQPLLSSSILDKAVAQDKKHISNDYKFYENYVELQSIELACFILSVCNVVLLAEDWFTDPNLFRLIKTAEMLTPNYPGQALTPSQAPSELEFNFSEHRPHLVYVLNKCGYMNMNELAEMKETVRLMTKGSKLIHRGSLSAGLSLHPGHHMRKRGAKVDKESINMLVIPKQDADPVEGFVGLPSFERSVTAFTNQILGIRRAAQASGQQPGSSNLFGPNFTEKKWFMFASKMWELIRKSTAINEYNRLMT